MKKLVVFLIAVCCLTCGACKKKDKEKDDSLVKKGTKSVMSKVVSTGKDALSGVKEGVSEGRKTGDSLDGAIVINNK